VPRTGLDVALVSQLHADAVFLLVGVTTALLVAQIATGAAPAVRRAMAVVLAVELVQGAVGYTQYFTGLPVVLVGTHLLGAALLVVAAVRAVDTMTDRSRTMPAPGRCRRLAGSRQPAAVDRRTRSSAGVEPGGARAVAGVLGVGRRLALAGADREVGRREEDQAGHDHDSARHRTP
jgi:hypothetical protein